MNLSCFKLCCDYSYWLNLTNVHDFPARGREGGNKQAKPKEKDFIRDVLVNKLSKEENRTSYLWVPTLYLLTITTTLSLENSRTQSKN